MTIVRATHLCDYMDWTSVDLNLTREGFFLSLLSFLVKKKENRRKKQITA